MNRDVLEGQWKQLKGKVKQQWGRLTDDELNMINGRYDELAGLIQERYGYSRDEAYNEDSDRKGIADIIIAKQRNGPTDTFKLVFLEEFTRFENPELGGYER